MVNLYTTEGREELSAVSGDKGENAKITLIPNGISVMVKS